MRVGPLEQHRSIGVPVAAGQAAANAMRKGNARPSSQAASKQLKALLEPVQSLLGVLVNAALSTKAIVE
jgi:hypothetical protein